MDNQGIFSQIYASILNFIHQFLSKFYEHKKVESLIVTDSDIKIICADQNLDEQNLLNYLRHHILFTDDQFYVTYFDEPILVRFKYLNETYQICLKKLESTKDDHQDIICSPKYLSAIIKDPENTENTINITEHFKEIHGHTKNFFKHIPDAVHDIPSILKDYNGGLIKNGSKLHTFNMMGHENIHEL